MLVLSASELKAQSEKRNVPEFTEISLGIAADVYIKRGNTQSLELRGDDDELEKVETEVSGGRLRIRKEQSWGWSGRSSRIEIYITMKALDGLSVSGSGRIVLEDQFSMADLNLDVSGSGKIDGNVDAGDIDADISGSGSINLKGRCRESSVDISGSGRYNALDMEGRVYDIRISGSGSCRINVVDEIEANISGSGSVRYKGDPGRVCRKVSGSGSVKHY
jgi:autotransporter translocation and assembly factor TamB